MQHGLTIQIHYDSLPDSLVSPVLCTKKASYTFMYEALKTAAIYSPTLQQYHRRGQALLLCSEWEEVEPCRYNHLSFFQL